MIEGYEAMRAARKRLALRGESCFGHGVLCARGMKAWIEAWSSWAPGGVERLTREPSPEGEPLDPEGLDRKPARHASVEYESLAELLAGMVLGHIQEAV